MATSKEFYNYIKFQLKQIDGISFRPMMGEYILYYKNKIIGGIYDNKLLLKNCKSIKKILTEINFDFPYPSGQKMVLISEIENINLIKSLIENIYNELYNIK